MMSKFTIQQVVDTNSGKYKKLLPRAYGFFRILRVTERVIIVKENAFHTIIFSDRAVPSNLDDKASTLG